MNNLERVFDQGALDDTICIPFGEMVTMPILKQIAGHFNIVVVKRKDNYYELTGTPENLFWLGCNFERKLTEAVFGASHFPGLCKVKNTPHA